MAWKTNAGQPIDEALRDSVLDRIEEGTFCLDDLKDYFTVFTQICNHTEDAQDEAEGFNRTFLFKIDGQPAVWMRMENLIFTAGSGGIDAPDITLDMSSEIALGIFTGALDPTAAYMNGDLKVDGIINDALLFRAILDIVQEELEG